MRNLCGGIIATAFLTNLPEALRVVGLPNSIAANLRQIACRLFYRKPRCSYIDRLTSCLI